MIIAQHVELFAHHMLLLAIPAFAPAIAVVGVVLYVAIRDRRAGPDPEHSDETEGYVSH